jgi:hypothetical protein
MAHGWCLMSTLPVPLFIGSGSDNVPEMSHAKCLKRFIYVWMVTVAGSADRAE